MEWKPYIGIHFTVNDCNRYIKRKPRLLTKSGLKLLRQTQVKLSLLRLRYLLSSLQLLLPELLRLLPLLP